MPTELVLYPREPHGLLERQHQLDYMRRILEAFDPGCGPRRRRWRTGRDMILGLPWEAWVLLLVAVGGGPAIVVPFYLNHRRDPNRRRAAADPRRRGASPRHGTADSRHHAADEGSSGDAPD